MEERGEGGKDRESVQVVRERKNTCEGEKEKNRDMERYRQRWEREKEIERGEYKRYRRDTRTKYGRDQSNNECDKLRDSRES